MSSEKILIVDDESTEREYMRACLASMDYEIDEAEDGLQALELVVRNPPDLVLLDLNMPRLDGWKTCRYLKQDPRTRFIPVVIVTSVDALPEKIRALDLGVSEFLNKPVNAIELATRVRSLLSMKHYVEELEHASTVLASVAEIIEERDAYTGGHGRRVGALAEELGRRAGIAPVDRKALALGASFHDIGKIAVPDAVLRKPGPLTPQEFESMKRHVVIGEGLCKPMKTLEKALPLIRHHHEHLDGSGYPDGLKAPFISPEVRILSVADVYDALTTDRPYRPAMPHPQAMEVLAREAAKGWWDPNVVALLGELVRQGAERLSAAPGK